MHWFFPAILSPACAAIVNHIDKHLLSRYFKNREIGAMLLFSSFVGFPLLLLLGISGVPIFSINTIDAVILLISGLLYMAAILPYFYALASDDTNLVAPLFQLISPITYVLGIFMLNETVEVMKVSGGVFIFFGAIILSLKKKNRKVSLNTSVFILMLVSSILFAMNGFLYKFSTKENPSFWISIFWEYLGITTFGSILYASIPFYRKQFHSVLESNSRAIVGLNLLNEMVAVASQLLINLALVLGPLAVVYWMVNGFQPFFVFLFGIIISSFASGKKRKTLKNSRQIIVAIVLMLIGALLLSL